MMLIKNIRNFFYNKIKLDLNYFYDYIYFKKFYSKDINTLKKDKNELASWIFQDKHRIEKAFSLPNTRFQFGEVVINRLSHNLMKYKEINDKDDIYFIGVGALKAYDLFHKEKSEKIPEFFLKNYHLFKDDINDKRCDLVGYKKRENKLDQNMLSDFVHFSKSRYSCRNYDKSKNLLLTEELLSKIIEISITAPSVCNRQHWHVHFFSGDKKNEILQYQNGNTGFTDNIPMIALVTSDLKAFYTEEERNQPYTDGGIFAMNLMYAMLSQGLESCPLNWCNSFAVEERFKKLEYIPKNEVVTVIIAFGFSHENAIYSKSPRLPVDRFFTLNN